MEHVGVASAGMGGASRVRESKHGLVTRSQPREACSRQGDGMFTVGWCVKAIERLRRLTTALTPRTTCLSSAHIAGTKITTTCAGVARAVRGAGDFGRGARHLPERWAMARSIDPKNGRKRRALSRGAAGSPRARRGLALNLPFIAALCPTLVDGAGFRSRWQPWVQATVQRSPVCARCPVTVTRAHDLRPSGRVRVPRARVRVRGRRVRSVTRYR